MLQHKVVLIGNSGAGKRTLHKVLENSGQWHHVS